MFLSLASRCSRSSHSLVQLCSERSPVLPDGHIFQLNIISEKGYVREVQLPSPVPNPAAAPPGTAPARPLAACAHGRFPNWMIKDNQHLHQTGSSIKTASKLHYLYSNAIYSYELNEWLTNFKQLLS